MTEAQSFSPTTQSPAAFIQSGWQLLPLFAKKMGQEYAQATFEAMLFLAKRNPELMPGFVKTGLAFARDNQFLRDSIIRNLIDVSYEHPAFIPDVVKAGWLTMASIKNHGGTEDSLRYEESRRVTDLGSELLEIVKEKPKFLPIFIEEGLKSLPRLANSHKASVQISVNLLLEAVDSYPQAMQDVVEGTLNIVARNAKQLPLAYSWIISGVAEDAQKYPELMPGIIEAAKPVIKSLGEVDPAEDRAKNFIQKLVQYTKDQPECLANLVGTGIEILPDVTTRHRSAGERLFASLLETAKNHPSLLPSVIKAGWQGCMPHLAGGIMFTQLSADMLRIAQTDEAARTALIEGLRSAIPLIAQENRWSVRPALMTLQSAMGLDNERKLVSAEFALSTRGRANNKQEIWYVPFKGNRTLVATQDFCGPVSDPDFKRRVPNFERVEQEALILGRVFNRRITTQAGVTEIRKTTNSRFRALDLDKVA